MKTSSALLAACALLAASGCFGLPEGSADVGDTVTIRYSAFDAADGKTLRANQTATFVLGSGGSGLGVAFERSLRGELQGASVDVRLDADDASTEVRVPRELDALPAVQTANRTQFERSVGPASVGQTFPAYGIYTGRVTNVTARDVKIEIDVPAGLVTPYPQLGVNLLSDRVGDDIVRSLDAIEGSTMTITPPTNPAAGTPFGLAPGQYLVVGADGDDLVLRTAPDLLGKDVRVRATVVRLTASDAEVEPVRQGNHTNYGVRTSPQVLGDPSTLDFEQAPVAGDDGHDDHGH